MHHLIILVYLNHLRPIWRHQSDRKSQRIIQISKHSRGLKVVDCDSVCSRICLCPCCLTRCSFLHFIAAQFREDLRWWRWCWDLQLAATLPPSPQQLKPFTILSAVAALKTLDSWPLPVFTAALQHCSLHHEANCEVYFCWWAAFRVFRQPGTRPLHKISNKEFT